MTVEKVRGLVRPIVTGVLVLSYVSFESYRVFVVGEKPSAEFVSLVGIVVAFWFAERKAKPSTP